MHISCSACSKFLYYQGEEQPGWNMLQHSVFFIHIFQWVTSLTCSTSPACSINSFGFLHWHQAAVAVSTSSDKCPWPLWDSINPVWLFSQCECIAYHVCCSWHHRAHSQLSLWQINTVCKTNVCLISNHSMKEDNSQNCFVLSRIMLLLFII